MSTIIILYMYLVEVDDETLHSKEVLPKAKDEHKGDKIEILQEGEFCKYMYIQAVASMVPISAVLYFIL